MPPAKMRSYAREVTDQYRCGPPNVLPLSCAALLQCYLHRRVSVGACEALQRRPTKARRDSFCGELGGATARRENRV